MFAGGHCNATLFSTEAKQTCSEKLKVKMVSHRRQRDKRSLKRPLYRPEGRACYQTDPLAPSRRNLPSFAIIAHRSYVELKILGITYTAAE